MKTLLCLLCLATSLCAQDIPEVDCYRANEFAVDLFGGVRSPDLDSERRHYGFGLQYYATRNIGIGVATEFENLSGHTFDVVAFRGLWRVPFERHAFYVFGGGTRRFHGDTGWSFQLGPAYEFRPVNHVGLFTEIGIDKVVSGDTRPVAATARAGLRFSW